MMCVVGGGGRDGFVNDVFCVAEWGWGEGGRHHCELCVVRGGGADGFLNCVVGGGVGGGGERFY